MEFHLICGYEIKFITQIKQVIVHSVSCFLYKIAQKWWLSDVIDKCHVECKDPCCRIGCVILVRFQGSQRLG